MDFLSNLISGLSLGSIYALIALGYTMVYGIAKMLNFAHGDIIMVGAFASIVFISNLGLPMLAGVALNPATPVMMLRDIICDVDMVLLMSVNPGFGGQKFIVQTLNKVRELRQLIVLNGSNALIEIDGGVNDVTGAQLAEAGADILVAGSYVFGAEDPIKTIEGLKNL